MAKKDEETKAEEPKIVLPSITAKNDTLAECNAQAHGLRMGASVRRKSILKRINDFVNTELKRA